MVSNLTDVLFYFIKNKHSQITMALNKTVEWYTIDDYTLYMLFVFFENSNYHPRYKSQSCVNIKLR